MTVGESKPAALVERLHDWLPRIQLAVRTELVALGSAAVPALVRALAREDRGIHVPAAAVLAEIGDERGVAPLIRLLESDASVMNRRAAADALGAIGSKLAFSPLLRVLGEDVSGLRDAAAEALGRLGDRRAVPAIVTMLEHEDGYSRAAATRALAQLRDPRAVVPLLHSRRDKWTRKAHRAVDALVVIGPAAGQPLRDALHDEAWYVREGAAEALGRTSDRPSVEALIRLVSDDPDARVRVTAAGALGHLGDRRAIEPLLGLRKRTKSLPRLHVIGRALESLGWRPASPTDRANLERLVDRENWGELAKIGAPAVTTLLSAARAEEYATRRGAVITLGQIGDARAVPDLVRHLEAQQPGVRVAAADALAKIGDRSAVGPLLRVLEEGDLWLRKTAATALGQIGDRRAARHLRKLTSPGPRGTRDLGLRAAAAGALCTLGPEPRTEASRVGLLIAAAHWDELVSMGGSAVPALLAALPSERESVQANVVRVLGRIGHAKAAATVIAWLFERPASIVGAPELRGWVKAMSELFGDYTDMLLRAASSVTRSKTDRSTEYVDDYDWKYSLRISNAGVRRICALNTEVAVYLLHQLANKKDAKVVVNYQLNEWGGGESHDALSFARQRKRAERELERRDGPRAKASSLLRRGAFRVHS